VRFSFCTIAADVGTQGLNAELDALGMEEEEDGGSYLADLNKAPDFIDEAPIEAPEVRHLWFSFD
jgi:charged multivesicular body protein 5